MKCPSCQWKHSSGTITLNGEVVRQGTVCELDAFCWTLRVPWSELDPEPIQPPRARHRPLDELLGLQQNPGSSLPGTPFG